MERMRLKKPTREKKEKEMIQKEEDRIRRLENERIAKATKARKRKEYEFRQKILKDMEESVKDGADEEGGGTTKSIGRAKEKESRRRRD